MTLSCTAHELDSPAFRKVMDEIATHCAANPVKHKRRVSDEQFDRDLEVDAGWTVKEGF